MSMKTFTTAAREATAEAQAAENVVEFVLDGRELTAYMPDDGQMAILMAETAAHNGVAIKVAGAIDFFMSVFDEDDAAHLRRRLLTRGDPFGVHQVQQIITYLIEEWTGHPFDKQSASTPSRSSATKNSKPRSQRST